MKRSLTLAGAGLIVAVLSGCQALEYSTSKPIIQRQFADGTGTGVMALTAERRLVYAKGAGSKMLVCSEPPPDVAQSFADSVRIAMQAAAQQNKEAVDVKSSAQASANLDLAREFSTSIAQIYTRSQGVQLFRDGAFMLCQSHVNEALSADEQVARARQRMSAIHDMRTLRSADKNAVPTVEEIALADALLGNFNYTAQFRHLLDTVHSVLIQELPNLYRYDVEKAKEDAVAAAARSKAAQGAAATAAAAASAAIGHTAVHRQFAAKSASAAASSAAAAAVSSGEAKASADAAAAAASAAGSSPTTK